MTLALLLAVLALSTLLTRALLAYAIRKGVLDVPNSRSSHSIPTPRGGGVAIVIAFLLGISVLMARQAIPLPLAMALFVSGLITAAIGFWDDHAPLSARLRLVAHFTAAGLALLLLGGMPSITVPGGYSLPSPVVQTFGVLMIVWLLNLYNFMDGIDGIAGVEAVTVAVGGSLVALVAGYTEGAVACLVLAAASGGFLILNFPPARIFMGDAGSGFLGLAFGVLAVDAARHSPALFWCWGILLGSFIVDASLTLIRRFVRGERLSHAHRSHAYQHAARAFGAHRPVTIAFGAINLLWLLPWALLSAAGGLAGPMALLVAWLPLVALAWRWRAGCAAEARG